MKKILTITFFIFFLVFSNNFAKTVKLDLNINNKIIEVWDILDLTIKAIDENGNIDKNFNWTVIIIEWENTTEWEINFLWFNDYAYPFYTFQKSDFWKKTLKKSVQFLTRWNKSILVNIEKEDGNIITWKIKIKIEPNNNILKNKLKLKIIPTKYIDKILKILEKAEKQNWKIFNIKNKIYNLINLFWKTPEKNPKTIQILNDILSILKFYQYI